MTVEISTFGSCASRNIFNSSINENYKDFFHINMSVETVTFISLMSNAIEYDSSLINSSYKYDNYCVGADLSKNFLNFLKADTIDYLIIDTHFDVFYSLIVVDDNCFISDSERLRKTKFYDLVKNNRKINIVENFDEYYKLFKKAIDLFFKFTRKHCPNIKIILNCCRSVSKYEDNGRIIDNENLKKLVNLNKYRDILDEYILTHYDVDVLNFDENTLANKNHIFGLHATHYESKYYQKKTQQLNDIIERNNIFYYYHKFNVQFRELQRKNQILKFYNKRQIKNEKLFISLNKYLTARIDIKNEKLDNFVKIIENSDDKSLVDYPSWFTDEKGKGLTIHSIDGEIDLKVKCYGDGELLIRFMGKDVKNNGVRIPIYVNYEEIYINNERIQESPKIACHDFPIYYKKSVFDGEIIHIRLKWSLF